MGNSTYKSLGWGNQPRVWLYDNGAIVAADGPAPVFPLSDQAEVARVGDGLYRMASIIDDQTGNPFLEAKTAIKNRGEAVSRIDSLLRGEGLTAELRSALPELQAKQLRASSTVVLLSIVESLKGRTGKDTVALQKRAMNLYFDLLQAETDALLAERMVINLDWVLPALPTDLAGRARKLMEERVPGAPPYSSWFKDAAVLRIDWKCGSEFLSGWLRRLQEKGFEVQKDGGEWDTSELKKTYSVGGNTTEVQLTIGPERGDVFRRMGDTSFHIVGYDGHSDWGRKIPRSLSNAPAQVGEKCIFYLLCCGKQILQKVRDVYPRAQIVTTFNSSRFSQDFKYSEDFAAFINILDGIARRENWDKIRGRVNGDWYNNPEKNYIFPEEALNLARLLDRDHDGQADMFDRLIDFNTFNVAADSLQEFTPRVPETPSAKIVGTRLHFGVQVFHTLAHFNEILEGFTHDLRVFAGGWFDPTAPEAGVISRGITRVKVEKAGSSLRYTFQGSCHYAHATEEAWRALAVMTLTEAVLRHEPAYRSLTALDRALTGLVMVSQCLDVDETFGRDEAVWKGMGKAMGLPEISLATVAAARRADEHWYAGSRASLATLKASLSQAQQQALTAWAEAPYSA